jgi:hypothetical protein
VAVVERCHKCDLLLVSLGFGYYYHPKVQNHFGQAQEDARQCSIAIDPLGNTFKIAQPHELIPEELSLQRSMLSY